MKKESGFSSKKISELKIKNKKKSEKVVQSKKNNDIFENQEIKENLKSFYDKEAKKYAETRKKFWHEEKAILDAITPLFGEKPPFDKGGADPEVTNGEAEGYCPPLGKEGNHEVVEDFYSGNKKIPSAKAVSPLSKGEQENPPYPPCQRGAKKKLRILEFGCGSGRFATLLNQNFAGKFDYVGIDLSEELLSYASKDNPELTFFQGDITKLIKNFEQESFDLIVGTSSFQHIPTAKERSFLMKNFYRLLGYDGILLMTNRSLSDWFVKKNWKIVMKARLKSWLRLTNDKTRDLMVPWTDENGIVYERFYHFFSLRELEKLSTFSGLSIKRNTFIDDKGNFTDNEKISRSSLFVARKSPIEG